MRRKLSIGSFVCKIVRDVSEEGAARLQTVDDLQRVCDSGVCRMWMMPKSVEEEQVESLS